MFTTFSALPLRWSFTWFLLWLLFATSSTFTVRMLLTALSMLFLALVSFSLATFLLNISCGLDFSIRSVVIFRWNPWSRLLPHVFNWLVNIITITMATLLIETVICPGSAATVAFTTWVVVWRSMVVSVFQVKGPLSVLFVRLPGAVVVVAISITVVAVSTPHTVFLAIVAISFAVPVAVFMPALIIFRIVVIMIPVVSVISWRWPPIWRSWSWFMSPGASAWVFSFPSGRCIHLTFFNCQSARRALASTVFTSSHVRFGLVFVYRS